MSFLSARGAARFYVPGMGPSRARRFVLLTLLVFLSAGCGAPQPPVQGHTPPDREPSPPPPEVTARWSDPSAWPGGVVPGVGAAVTVPAGTTLLLDVTPPPLESLTVDGALVFDDRDLELTAGSILVHGGVYAGSSTEPFRSRAVITLTGPVPAEEHGHMGTKYLAVMGGTVELYGAMTGSSWTRLARDARPGDTVITLQDAAGWSVGDAIVLASTDFLGYADGKDEQVEERTVTAVAGSELTLDEPLDYFHQGSLMTVGGIAVDQRAEVARLGRNIVIRGDEQSDDGSYGGHLMVMGGGRLRLDAVELTRMGQRGRLARYPVHFHQLGAAGAASFVTRTSIHDNYHRCLTIHGTDGVLVADVVGYATYGHCFFMEDGDETGNELYGNLALMVMKPPEGEAVLASDRSHLGPAGFWVTNPANDLVGNVAAGSQGSGFWYAFPEHPTGLASGRTDMWPRRTPLGLFRDNVAHSNRQVGLHVDNGPTADVASNPPTWYEPRLDPHEEDTATYAVFEGFVAYKHRDAGAWFRGSHAVLAGGVLSDNSRGVTFASDESGAEGTAFVGETPNVGTWPSWDEASAAAGRHLPRPWNASYTIRGFEFYDGTVHVSGSRFAGYESDARRQAAALSYLDFTSFATAADNHAEDLWFAPGTNRVYLSSRDGTPDLDGEDGYRSAVFKDVDGSVTGQAGATVTANSPYLMGDGCTYQPAWNAGVCSGRFVNLTLDVVAGPPGGIGPVTVSREGGASHVMHGSPDDVRHYFRTVARYGEEHAYSYSGSPSRLRLGVTDGVSPGDELIVSLPWEGGSAYLYRDWWVDSRNRQGSVDSLPELRASDDTAYLIADGRLWVKLVVQPGRDWAYMEVCAAELCA